MADACVEFSKLKRVYQQGSKAIEALVEASGAVLAGQRIALVGPSGSGKSTLLQLLGGLDVPTSGEVRWPTLGHRESLRPRQIGYVFQSQSLLAPLNVMENVELPLLMVSEEGGKARQRAVEALAQLGLELIANKLPEELSGGQAQRVAVARAFVGRPRIILADEPTGQLDQPTAQQLFDVLFAALDKTTALVVATHDLAVAKRFPIQWRIDHGILETRT